MRIPSWVKLERKGDRFTGYHSLDGVHWTRQSDTEDTQPNASPHPQAINMPRLVYVGLALTSHAPDIVTTATCSGVEITGGVTGPWQVAEIGADHPGDSPDDLYVVVGDGKGKTAVVVNSDPAAVNARAWTEWKISLSDFAGVDLRRVSKIGIGVGGRESPIPVVTGRLRIDEIRASNQPTSSILGLYLADTGELVLSDQDNPGPFDFRAVKGLLKCANRARKLLLAEVRGAQSRTGKNPGVRGVSVVNAFMWAGFGPVHAPPCRLLLEKRLAVSISG